MREGNLLLLFIDLAYGLIAFTFVILTDTINVVN